MSRSIKQRGGRGKEIPHRSAGKKKKKSCIKRNLRGLFAATVLSGQPLGGYCFEGKGFFEVFDKLGRVLTAQNDKCRKKLHWL